MCAYMCVLLSFENKSKKRRADKKASNSLKGLQPFDSKKLIFSWDGGMYAGFFPHCSLGFPVIAIGALLKCKFTWQCSPHMLMKNKIVVVGANSQVLWRV